MISEREAIVIERQRRDSNASEEKAPESRREAGPWKRILGTGA
jgi:hypothetical protein